MDKKRKTQAIFGGAAVLVAAAVALGAPRGQKVAQVEPPPPIPVAEPPAPPVPPAPQPLLIAQPVPPPPQPVPPPPKARPKVEVVFVLDTTGSMTGLISGAKRKIWSMANHIATGQPTPDVKIGLVAYRDIGDEYVTRDFPLSADLDGVYSHLMGFRADGGGDTPEHVNKALWDAVHKMQWSDDSMKMIFLVGDAPPHMDYGDGYDWHKIVREAGRKEIAVHAIRCGNDPDTAYAWREIASLGHGTYASIAEEGGVVARATQMDDEMARLSRELSDTTIIYGDHATRGAYAAKATAAASAPAEAAADRGGFYAKTRAKLDESDLTDKGGAGGVAVGSLDSAKLPDEMRSMTPEQRKTYIEGKRADREKILKQMSELSAKRDAYIREENKKTKAGKDGFDRVVDDAITEQGKSYGLSF